MYHLGLFTKNLVETIVKYILTYICRNYVALKRNTHTHTHKHVCLKNNIMRTEKERRSKKTQSFSHTHMRNNNNIYYDVK